MSYQAVCIFAPISVHQLAGSHPLGALPSHSVIDFLSPAERQEFCDSPAVWWYQFAEDIDFGGEGRAIGQPRRQNVGVRQGREWNKGGAWEAAEAELALETESNDMYERGDLW